MTGDTIRLQHILRACQQIASLSASGRSDVVEQALMYQIIVIGEAASKLSKELKDRSKHLPWPNITAMRNLLVHEYFRVESGIVWQVVEVHTPMLAEWVKKELEL